MYRIGALVTCVVLVLAHAADNADAGYDQDVVVPPPYNVHLFHLDDPNVMYPYGIADDHRAIIEEQLPRIGESTLQDGNKCVILLGRMQGGKTSIVERLMMVGFGTLLNRDHDGDGGDTQYAQAHTLDILHDNSFFVIDTPGFGEIDQENQERVLAEVENAAQITRTLNAELIGLYFVVDATARNLPAIGPNLTLIMNFFGETAGSKLRFIVNQCDQLAYEGEEYIRDEFTTSLQEEFRLVFKALPDKILFTCAGYFSEVGCIGQLIDDICGNVAEGDRSVPVPATRNQTLLLNQIRDELVILQAIHRSASTLWDDSDEELQTANNDLRALEDRLRHLRDRLTELEHALTEKDNEVSNADAHLQATKPAREWQRGLVNDLKWNHVHEHEHNYQELVNDAHYRRDQERHKHDDNFLLQHAKHLSHSDNHYDNAVETEFSSFEDKFYKFLNRLREFEDAHQAVIVANQDLTTRHQEFANLNDEIATLENEIESMEGGIQAKQDEITRLKQALDEAYNEFFRSQESVSHLQQEIDEIFNLTA